jgi:filamentous hemagglutinin
LGLICAGGHVTHAANFTCSWNDATANWTAAADWSNCNGTDPNNAGGNTYDVTISTGDPTLTKATTIGSVTINSPGAWTLSGSGAAATLTGTLSNSGTVALLNGASLTTTGVGLTNMGLVNVDGLGGNAGGSSLTIGGTLTNSAGATLNIGNPSALANGPRVATMGGGLTNTGTVIVDTANFSGGSTVTVGGTLDNSGGKLGIGNTFLGAPTTVTATRLGNTGGMISIVGGRQRMSRT